MKIKSIQKVIKVGTSLAVTIPSKDADYAGIAAGDMLEVTYETKQPDSRQVEVVELTQNLIKRHKQALKNLSQR